MYVTRPARTAYRARAAGARLKLLLDEYFPPDIAARLRERSDGVVAVCERPDLISAEDETLLLLSTAEQRALLINNVRDFIPIATRWAGDGRTHHGHKWVVLEHDDRDASDSAATPLRQPAFLALRVRRTRQLEAGLLCPCAKGFRQPLAGLWLIGEPYEECLAVVTDHQ
jgi:hypothetical protein